MGEVAALLPHGASDGLLDIALGDRTERLYYAAATPNFFNLLGVRAARGRVFNGTDEINADPLIVLSDALWRRNFGGDPAIVGRPITLTSGAGGTARVAKTFIVAGI